MKEKVVFLIGNPIEHSISPKLHNTIFDFLNMKYNYGKRLVRENELREVVESFRKSKGLGFNVTIPHKVAIMQYLDEISEEAHAIGAVNTVKYENDKLVGYNTDCKGFEMQLVSDGVYIEGKRIKILGAGGAARAVVFALINAKAKEITIYNRSLDKARNLCGDLPQITDCKTLQEFEASNCDVIINTTSIGLAPNVEDSPVCNFAEIESQTQVVDLIYNPHKTKFMKLASEYGVPTYNGMKMLVFQAMAAHDLWFDNNVCDNRELVTRLLEELYEG